MKRKARDSEGRNDWSALVAALRQRATISSSELRQLVRKFTHVSGDYALWRLQREGVLSKIDKRRRALYLVVEKGSEAFIKDPIEAVHAIYGKGTLFGYGTALFMHGLSRYGRLTENYVISPKAQRQKEIGDLVVRFIKSPLPEEIGVITQRYANRLIRLTDLERTLIDCIHRPKYAQGWENVVHALHRARGVNADRMTEYVKLYRTPSLVARVGFVLEQFGKKWRAASKNLDSLRPYLPREPVKFDRKLGGKLRKEWNLYVPEGLFDE
jgi:predicted transcriptional regulator of viral defense system